MKIIILAIMVFLMGNMESSSKGSQVEFADFIPVRVGSYKYEAMRVIKELGCNFKVDTNNKIVSISYNKIDSMLPQINEPISCSLSFCYDSLDLVNKCKLVYFMNDSLTEEMSQRMKKSKRTYFLRRVCRPIIMFFEKQYGLGLVGKGDLFQDEWFETVLYFSGDVDRKSTSYSYYVENSAANNQDTCKLLFLSIEYSINRNPYKGL
jgi:hypothetical protein